MATGRCFCKFPVKPKMALFTRSSVQIASVMAAQLLQLGQGRPQRFLGVGSISPF
jgi:hypothetical protein